MHLHDILKLEFARFGNRPLNIVETGTLRNDTEPSRIGDGWSTIFFAERVKQLGGKLWSIDLETGGADRMLRQRGLRDCCELLQRHSLAALASLCRAHDLSIDIAFLDSDNDGTLIYHEFLVASELVAAGGLILMDDVRMAHHLTGEAQLARKGDVVLPYVVENKLAHRLHERHGWNDYRTGVLAVDR